MPKSAGKPPSGNSRGQSVTRHNERLGKGGVGSGKAPIGKSTGNSGTVGVRAPNPTGNGR